MKLVTLGLFPAFFSSNMSSIALCVCVQVYYGDQYASDLGIKRQKIGRVFKTEKLHGSFIGPLGVKDGKFFMDYKYLTLIGVIFIFTPPLLYRGSMVAERIRDPPFMQKVPRSNPRCRLDKSHGHHVRELSVSLHS